MSKATLGGRARLNRADENELDSTEALALLSDEHARRIVELLEADSLSAREISDRLDVSRATVYRRLDRLESAGLVESAVAYDSDGHHRQVFQPTVEELTVSIDRDGVTVERVE